MNKFLTDLKKLLYLRKDEMLLTLGVEAVGMVIGIVVFFIIYAFDNTVENSFEIGAAFAMGLACLMIGLVGMGTFGVYFNNAVTMGRTRKSFIVSYMIINMLQFIVCTAFAVGIAFAEKAVYGPLYKNIGFEFVVITNMTPEGLILVFLLVMLMPVLFGELILKYGYKVMWIFWAFGMSFNLIPWERIANIFKNRDFRLLQKTGDFITSIPVNGWFYIGYFIIALFFVISCKMILKQGVTG